MTGAQSRARGLGVCTLQSNLSEEGSGRRETFIEGGIWKEGSGIIHDNVNIHNKLNK
jgi:hypothetical protein